MSRCNNSSTLNSSVQPKRQRVSYNRIGTDNQDWKLDGKRIHAAIREAKQRFKRWLSGGKLLIDSSHNPLICPPPFCPFCGKPVVNIHAHHPYGSDWENRYSIIFVCQTCHNEIHALETEMWRDKKPLLSGLREFILRKIEMRNKILAAPVYNVDGASNMEVPDDNKQQL